MTSRAIEPATVLAPNAGMTEGPLFARDGTLAVVSVDRGHVLNIARDDVSIRAVTGTGPNGLAEGADGSIYVAMGGRGGMRPRDDTATGILAIRPDGRLQWVTQLPIAPNDLCFGPDGLLYFTDPSRGRRDDGRVWRVDVETGQAELLVSVGWYPNGIGFGLGDDVLFVADTSNGQIRRFPVGPGGLGPDEVAIELDQVVPDGFAFDAQGNVVIAVQGLAFADPKRVTATSPDGNVLVTYSTTGELLDTYRPDVGINYTNVAISPDGRLAGTCAGDTRRTATGHEPGGCVYLVEHWPVPGLLLHPFRAAIG